MPRAIVLEDEADIRNIIVVMLQVWGFDSLSFAIGTKAMDWIQLVNSGHIDESEFPELAILDIRVPGINGDKISRHLRDSPKLSKTTIILASAFVYSDEGIVNLLNESGADLFLHKPLPDFDQLGKIVKQTIEQRKQKNDQQENPNQASLPPSNISSPQTQESRGNNLAKYKGTILAVEDEPNLLLSIRDLFELDNYKVFTAQNGFSALNILIRNHVDLVVSDIMMPHMDGTELLTVVRQQTKWNHVPFIFLTAKGEKSDIQRGRRLGVDDYLIKPFDADDLLIAVESKLERFEHQKALVRRSNAQSNSSSLEINTLFICSISHQYQNAQLFSTLSRKFLIPQRSVRESIALFQPQNILIDSENPFEVVTKVKEFPLSRSTPVVVLLHDVELKAYNVLIALGADEVCLAKEDAIRSAIIRSVKQYEVPILVEIGEEWQTAIISADAELQQRITNNLKSRFLTNVEIFTSVDDLIVRFQGGDFDLILIDGLLINPKTTYPLTAFHERYVNTPIVLLLDTLKEELFEQIFSLNVYGLVPRDAIEDHLIPQIERLLRWGDMRQPLLDTWTQSRSRVTALEYQSKLLQDQLHLFQALVEVDTLYAGLIHDLRNVLYSLHTQLEMMQKRVIDSSNVEQIKLIRDYHQYANVMLETIANIRVKTDWSPKEYSEHQILSQIHRSISLAKLKYPSLVFGLKDKSEALFLDGNQFLYMLTILWMAIGDKDEACTINIQLVTNRSFSFVVTIQSDHTKSMSEALGAISKDNSPVNLVALLNIEKFALNHQWRWEYEEESLRFSWSNPSKDELSFRMDIAKCEDQIEDLQKQVMPTKSSEISAAPSSILTAYLSFELLRGFQNIVYEIGNLRIDSKRLGVTAQYGLLLARNLFLTGTDYTPNLTALSLSSIFETLYQLRKDNLKECDFTVFVEAGTPPVMAEELGLLQILVNLVTNASEAMSGAGKLTIEAAPHGKLVKIKVIDTGYGISSENLQKIFNLFFSTKPGHERGIGLHLVQSLIRKFNGTIDVHSELNEGTTFTILLPAAITDQS